MSRIKLLKLRIEHKCIHSFWLNVHIFIMISLGANSYDVIINRHISDSFVTSLPFQSKEVLRFVKNVLLVKSGVIPLLFIMAYSEKIGSQTFLPFVKTTFKLYCYRIMSYK